MEEPIFSKKGQVRTVGLKKQQKGESAWRMRQRSVEKEVTQSHRVLGPITNPPPIAWQGT